MLIGVVLDKKDIESLLLLESGIVLEPDNAFLWDNLYSIGAVKYSYALKKWFKVVKKPALTWIGEDIIDEYRYKSEVEPSIQTMYIDESLIGNPFLKFCKSLFHL